MDFKLRGLGMIGDRGYYASVDINGRQHSGRDLRTRWSEPAAYIYTYHLEIINFV